MLRPPFPLAALCLGAALLLTACGGDDEPASTPTATPSATAPTAVATEPAIPRGSLPNVRLQRVFPALSFARLTGMYQAPDGRFFVLEQGGVIRVFDNRNEVAAASVFLDITDRVTATSFETGLLGLAFAPNFAQSGVFYVNYTAPNPLRTVVSRFTAPAPRTAADPASEQAILTVDQPFPNHNGGQTSFGPDGFLYIGMGDGGAGNDPFGNGQNLGVLLGKLLRIDVGGTSPGLAYRIPPDNPFAGRQGARGEIWAYGLRNPWRFSFDRETGQLWLGDVGQNFREEIDIIEKGGNYGWSVMEGMQCRGGGSNCDRAGLIPPVIDYPTTGFGGDCSVTGGFVYRGSAIPALRGAYVYGDYCSGKIWALRWDGSRVMEQGLLIDSDIMISSFAQDAQGEIYALAHSAQGGGIYKLVP
jgi:glucose/arabinose dehydrogenase